MAVTPPHVTRGRVTRVCLKLSNTLINIFWDDSSACSIHNMDPGNATPHDQICPPPDEHEHEQEHEQEHEHDDEDDAEPQEQMEIFDWQALQTEYLDAMTECKAEEDAHLQEFASLSRFFQVWAETVSGHEQKRSHQRYAYLQPRNELI